MNIEPHIEIGEPGQPITLYEGQLEVHVGQKSNFCEDSRIVFVFLPEPRIEFYLTRTRRKYYIDTGCIRNAS